MLILEREEHEAEMSYINKLGLLLYIMFVGAWLLMIVLEKPRDDIYIMLPFMASAAAMFLYEREERK